MCSITCGPDSVFTAIMCDLSPEELKACFDKHAGSDGKLSKRELRGMIREKMGDEFKGAKNPHEMKKVFDKLDEDGDGKLDFEEFKNALEKIKQVKDGVPFDQIKCS